MGITQTWRKEAGPRLQGSRDLDSAKLQAPCIVALPSGGFRLFYTAVGPAKPFSTCQGYILSAVSDDGLVFRTEPGIRLAPRPALPHMCLRLLAPTVTSCGDGRWRMYFESRGSADRPTVICSAVSALPAICLCRTAGGGCIASDRNGAPKAASNDSHRA